MRLYIWHNVLRDYSDGLAFAIADSEEHAREVILASCDDWERHDLSWQLRVTRHPIDGSEEPNPPEVIEIDQPFGMAIAGGS